MSKQAKVKNDGILNPQNYDSINLDTANLDSLRRYGSTEVDRRAWLNVQMKIEVGDQGDLKPFNDVDQLSLKLTINFTIKTKNMLHKSEIII